MADERKSGDGWALLYRPLRAYDVKNMRPRPGAPDSDKVRKYPVLHELAEVLSVSSLRDILREDKRLLERGEKPRERTGVAAKVTSRNRLELAGALVPQLAQEAEQVGYQTTNPLHVLFSDRFNVTVDPESGEPDYGVTDGPLQLARKFLELAPNDWFLATDYQNWQTPLMVLCARRNLSPAWLDLYFEFDTARLGVLGPLPEAPPPRSTSSTAGGADAEAPRPVTLFGAKPLHVMASNGPRAVLLRRLLTTDAERGVARERVTARGAGGPSPNYYERHLEGATPLLLACMANRPAAEPDAVQLLARAAVGVDLDTQDLQANERIREDGDGDGSPGFEPDAAWTYPLHALCGNPDVSAGTIEFTARLLPLLVSTKDRHGQLPVHILCANRAVTAAKLRALAAGGAITPQTLASRVGATEQAAEESDAQRGYLSTPVSLLLRNAARDDIAKPSRPGKPWIDSTWELSDDGHLRPKQEWANMHFANNTEQRNKLEERYKHSIQSYRAQWQGYLSSMRAYEHRIKEEQASRPSFDSDALRVLLAADRTGAHTLLTDARDSTVLHYAASLGLARAVGPLLDRSLNGSRLELLARANGDGETAVMIATRRQDTACLAALLGFSPHLLEEAGEQEIMAHALRAGLPSLLELVVRKNPGLLRQPLRASQLNLQAAGPSPAKDVSSPATQRQLADLEDLFNDDDHGLDEAPAAPAAQQRYGQAAAAAAGDGLWPLSAVVVLGGPAAPSLVRLLLRLSGSSAEALSLVQDSVVEMAPAGRVGGGGGGGGGPRPRNALFLAAGVGSPDVLKVLVEDVQGIASLVTGDVLQEVVSSGNARSADLLLSAASEPVVRAAVHWWLGGRALNRISLPASALRLEQLAHVDLSRNALTVFPRSVLRLVRLRVLNLAHNRIKQLRRSDIRALQVHQARAQHLRQLQEAAGQPVGPATPPDSDLLAALAEAGESYDGDGPRLFVDLRHNRLSTIPPELYGVRTVSVATSGNPLRTSLLYPAWFFGVPFSRFQLFALDTPLMAIAALVMVAGVVLAAEPRLAGPIVATGIGIFFVTMMTGVSWLGFHSIDWTDSRQLSVAPAALLAMMSPAVQAQATTTAGGGDGDPDEPGTEGSDANSAAAHIQKGAVAARDGTEGVRAFATVVDTAQSSAVLSRGGVQVCSSLADALTIATMAVEFPALLSFSFALPADILRWPRALAAVLRAFVLDLSIFDDLNIDFHVLRYELGLWLAVAAVLVQRCMLEFSLWPRFGARFASALQISVNLLALPIFAQLTKSFDCTYTSGGPIATLDDLAASGSPAPCWSGQHLVYAGVSLVCFALYYSMAVLSGPIWQHRQRDLSIKFPAFVIIGTAQLKLVLALLTTFFTRTTWLYLSINMAVALALLTLVALTPLPVKGAPHRALMIKVKLGRMGSYAACLVGSCVATVVVALDGNNESLAFAALMCMLGVDALIVGGCLLGGWLWLRNERAAANSKAPTSTDPSGGEGGGGDGSVAMADFSGKSAPSSSSDSGGKPIACQRCRDRRPQALVTRRQQQVWLCRECAEGAQRTLARNGTVALLAGSVDRHDYRVDGGTDSAPRPAMAADGGESSASAKKKKKHGSKRASKRGSTVVVVDQKALGEALGDGELQPPIPEYESPSPHEASGKEKSSTEPENTE